MKIVASTSRAVWARPTTYNTVNAPFALAKGVRQPDVASVASTTAIETRMAKQKGEHTKLGARTASNSANALKLVSSTTSHFA